MTAIVVAQDLCVARIDVPARRATSRSADFRTWGRERTHPPLLGCGSRDRANHNHHAVNEQREHGKGGQPYQRSRCAGSQ